MAFSRAAHLAGVVFGVVPLALILFVTVGYLATKADARLLDVEGQSGTLLEQILGSMRVVKSFAAETFLIKKYDQYLIQARNPSARNITQLIQEHIASTTRKMALNCPWIGIEYLVLCSESDI